jgi:hypothetical protein
MLETFVLRCGKLVDFDQTMKFGENFLAGFAI